MCNDQIRIINIIITLNIYHFFVVKALALSLPDILKSCCVLSAFDLRLTFLPDVSFVTPDQPLSPFKWTCLFKKIIVYLYEVWFL